MSRASHPAARCEESAREGVTRSRSKSRLSPEKAMDLAVEETRLRHFIVDRLASRE